MKTVQLSMLMLALSSVSVFAGGGGSNGGGGASYKCAVASGGGSIGHSSDPFVCTKVK